MALIQRAPLQKVFDDLKEEVAALQKQVADQDERIKQLEKERKPQPSGSRPRLAPRDPEVDAAPSPDLC